MHPYIKSQGMHYDRSDAVGLKPTLYADGRDLILVSSLTPCELKPWANFFSGTAYCSFKFKVSE